MNKVKEKPIQKIRATIAPESIKKSNRFFDNSLQTIYTELSQNARRAQATTLRITLLPLDETRTHIVFEDNGTGVQDFGKLLQFGKSDWTGNIARKEDAAGMGFFCLANLGATVISMGKTAHFTPASFVQDEDVEVFEHQGPEFKGTRIIFTYPMPCTLATEKIDAHCRYNNFDTYINEKKIPKRDFLEGAEFITTWKNLRLGVFAEKPSLQHAYSDGDTNFYGLRLNTRWASYPKLIQGQDGTYKTVYVRVDIPDTEHLELQLPDRKSLLMTPQLEETKRKCHELVWQYCIGKIHRLPYKNYEQAKKVFPELGESEENFATLYVYNGGDREDYNNQYPSSVPEGKGITWLRPPQWLTQRNDHFLLGNIYQAIEENGQDILFMQEDQENENYTWYQRKPEVTRIELWIDDHLVAVEDGDQTIDLSLNNPQTQAWNENNKPETIVWKVITNQETYLLPCSVLFLGTKYEGIDSADFVVTKACQITVDEFEELATFFYFEFNPDHDGDYDTEYDEFTKKIERISRLYLHGPEAELNTHLKQIRDRIQADLPKQLDSIQFIKDPNCPYQFRIHARLVTGKTIDL
jgi:hypothetical protein